jgi:hypothetical protein
VVLFGGLDDDDRPLADTWVQTTSGWRALRTSASPGARAFASLTEQDGAVMLVGGWNGSEQLDIWRLEVDGNQDATWALVTTFDDPTSLDAARRVIERTAQPSRAVLPSALEQIEYAAANVEVAFSLREALVDRGAVQGVTVLVDGRADDGAGVAAPIEVRFGCCNDTLGPASTSLALTVPHAPTDPLTRSLFLFPRPAVRTPGVSPRLFIDRVEAVVDVMLTPPGAQ